MRDGPVTAVRRIATCPVPPLSTPPTIELVSMGSVGCHVALSATAPSDAVRFPSGVLYTAWTSTLERSPSLRAKKRNDGYATLTQTNGDCAEAHALASEERTRRFVTDAAHELRTPIAGIAAAAEAVLHQTEDADVEQRQRLELLLVRESHRAARLVDDLVNLARLDAGVELQRGPVELRGLAATQADRVRVLHPALTIAVRGVAQVVDADARRVTEILANLLDNACHATPAGGRVEVRVGRNDELTEFAEVTVADTGPGVPPPDRERIFDRLVRLDPARDRQVGGSGLGLAIARGLARAHGGDLHCQPPPPGATGAVFQLLLPISDNGAHSTGRSGSGA